MYISEQSKQIQEDIRKVIDNSDYTVAAIEIALRDLSSHYSELAYRVSRTMPIKDIIAKKESMLEDHDVKSRKNIIIEAINTGIKQAIDDIARKANYDTDEAQQDNSSEQS